MIDKPVSMSQWATRLGRNPRWLEQKTIMAITAYRDNHRMLLAEDPEDRAELEDQLALALYHQLEYATYLAEHSIIGDG